MRTEESWAREGNRYTSDLFSLLGTIILWVFWPSFNGLLATGAARHRAVINTYLSLMASTAMTFVISGLMGHKKFAPEDIQNATLAGGVVVGASADMVLQPYGAVTAGTVAGVVSCLGYKVLTGRVMEKLGIHDTCGVNNLHGVPGLMAALLSIIVTLAASEESWGPELYKVFPLCAPPPDSFLLDKVQAEDPGIEAGEGRSLGYQALMQLLGLGLTLVVSVVLGAVVGTVMSIHKLCDGIDHDKLFEDELFWEMAEDDNPGYEAGKEARRKRSRARSHSLARSVDHGDPREPGAAEKGDGAQLQIPALYQP